jgi:hypothetical protein
MADQSQSREQEDRKRSRQRRPPEQSNPPAQNAPDAVNAAEQTVGIRSGESPAFKAGPQKRTAGRAGENALAIEWIPAPVPWPGGGMARSVRFRVSTTGGGALEARLEQLAYNRSESGNGTLTTQIVPAAPVGTSGKLTARDIATGETLEQPWIWVGGGSAGGWSLWAAIKRLIWPGK